MLHAPSTNGVTAELARSQTASLTPTAVPTAVAGDCYLPDFGSPRAVVALVLISQLVALALTLATALFQEDFYLRLARVSLLMVWIALTTASVLTLARPALLRYTAFGITLGALLLAGASIALVSEAVYWFGQYFAASRLVAAWPLFPGDRWQFLLRNLLLGVLVAACLLRYFYVTHQWRAQVERTAESRIAALQARIRPHFLFNSMNTIAALVRSDPVAAEQAVEDLSDLFRASLARSGHTNSLREELEIARVYQRMEQQRLGSRLTVEWQLDTLPLDARLPGLTLQPLLENAIYHGIEPLEGGGTVTVGGSTDGSSITLTISNPVSNTSRARHSGHQLALDNIRQRLQLAFGDRAHLTVSLAADHFSVSLVFPLSNP